MEPLRKDKKFEDEKFDRTFMDEKSKPADISRSGEFKQEEAAEAYPEAKKGERFAVPMGPMPAAVPEGEAQEPKESGPRLVSKEPKEPGEAKKAGFFKESELREMRARWDKIQGTFVDQPQQAVEDADNLIGEAIKKLSQQLADERTMVIRQWNSGENVSTEALRQSLRRYRTFFDRLLAA